MEKQSPAAQRGRLSPADKKRAQLTRDTTLQDLVEKLTPYAGGEEFEIKPEEVEYHEKPGGWNFKGVSHGVARAIRVPYTFYWFNEDTKSTVEIRDYFLIGFEGGAGY